MRVAILLVLGSMSAVLVAPLAASAAEWTHEGVPLAEPASATFTGTVEFNSGENGGIHCSSEHVAIVATPGGTGQVTEFTKTGCDTFGPLLEVFGCELEGHPTAEGLPWSIDATQPGVVTITDPMIVNHMNPGCALGSQINVEGGTITATANNSAAVSSVSLGGVVDTNIGESSPSGTLAVSPAGTYGIE